MSVPEEMFDEDYLYFYRDVLGDERSDADARTVLELLSLEPGMRVLDVPCGEGRLAGRLAGRGCDVVGVDSSELFLGLARERYPAVRFVRGDMRELAYDREFDVVVNWFTSFGYFDRAANDRVLDRFARALRPGGRLLLELLNPAWLARLLELTGGRSASVVERDGDLMVDRVTYNPADARSHTERFIVRNRHVRKLEFSLEQVAAPELKQRLHAAGFDRVELFGHGGAPFDPEGRRLIAVAHRS
ncbi:MAG: class I SAM-dependent methyltransferase [Solirubrobacteraceae bacterium]